MIKKINDLTFLYIFHCDSIERMENLLLSIDYIMDNFDSNIQVLEVNKYNNGILQKLLSPKVCYSFIQDDDCILHRTKYLNLMYKNTSSKFIAVFDCDVIIPQAQIIEAINILRSNQAQVVYPYNKFLDTSNIIRNLYIKTKNVAFLFDYQDFMSELYSPGPTGGAFMCDLNSYNKIGWEIEDFYGWGVEDGERYARWRKSKFELMRLDGPLFHLTHPRYINSQIHSQAQNAIKKRLFNKIIYGE